MKLNERFSSLSPIYDGGLTNHLPMMITALKLLDVNEEDIELIATEYYESKNLLDLSDTLIENDPYNTEYIRLTNYFLSEINQSTMDDTIHTFLNENEFSLHSGLYHGLIRLAYAYLESNDLLVAQALAYFTLIKSSLILKGTPSKDINTSFEELVEIRRENVTFEKQYTMEKLEELISNKSIIDNLFFPKDFLNNKHKALELFVDFYNKTQDFYILHVITGYHALHILSQHFDHQEKVFDNFFMQSVLFMLFNEHKEYTTVLDQNEFPYFVKHVPMLRDAHDIKLFYSLSYFYERYEYEPLKKSAQKLFNL
jgi:hypothetical protein